MTKEAKGNSVQIVGIAVIAAIVFAIIFDVAPHARTIINAATGEIHDIDVMSTDD